MLVEIKNHCHREGVSTTVAIQFMYSYLILFTGLPRKLRSLAMTRVLN